MPRRPRSAPSYLVHDAARDAWDLRFRYVDSIGRVHWPRERSPYPHDLVRSRQWAPWRRQQLIAEIEAEIHRVEVERAAPVTLGQVLDAYAADCRERGTRWPKERSRARIARETLGAATAAADLTAARLASWRAALREQRGLSPRTCNAYVALVRAALNFAVDRGMLTSSPLGRLRALPETRRAPLALSDRQVAALLVACRIWERRERRPVADRRRLHVPIVTRVLLGYWTGGRPEALEALRWRDVDLARGVVTYRSKGHSVVCPLEPELVEHLAGRAGAADDLVLLSPRTGRAVGDWRPPWRRLVRLANRRLSPEQQIPAATPLHALRHTRITHLLLAGASPQVVAQVTGTSLTMLQRHYAHVMLRGLQDELARVREHPSMTGLSAFAHGHKKSDSPAHSVRHERAPARRNPQRLKIVS